jgi:Uma2 family endonuclease
MSSVAQRILTAEEFAQLPEAHKHQELVRGEVVDTAPSGALRGAITANIAARLAAWAQGSGHGCVSVASGYIVSRGLDTVRGPDISYLRADGVPAGGVPEGFWVGAPDLAVEVVSPSETADEVREKVRDFLAAGTPLVWTVYPRTREVVVHTPDGMARTFGADDVIEYPEVLPGFSCRVAELFS